MRIALINTIKPVRGTGDGMTEYTYQLYRQFSKAHEVDLVYSVDKLVRYDVKGLLYTNTLFKNRLSKIAQKDYDIAHITNQEMGFAAKIIKKKNPGTKVVTTLQDLARIEGGVQKGMLQHAYNQVVRKSISDAFRHSDFMIFTSSQTMEDIGRYFRFKCPSKVINLAVRESILKGVLHKKRNTRFNVGYVGSFASHKNVGMLLKAANLMKKDDCDFTIYGKGIEYDNLVEFKKEHGLDKVKLMGFAPEDKITSIYDSFDAFVFPSRYEGFGMPILEAQARGIPIIIYKDGKISKEVRRYCFEADSEEGIARIIKSLMDKGYNRGLKRKATAYAKSFTWKRTAEETLEVYKSLLKY